MEFQLVHSQGNSCLSDLVPINVEQSDISLSACLESILLFPRYGYFMFIAASFLSVYRTTQYSSAFILFYSFLDKLYLYLVF